MVEIIVYQSHSWTLSRFNCNQAIIDNQGSYLDRGAITGQPNVVCQPNVATCTAAGWTLINDPNYCTDFSLAVQISSGALLRKRTINRNANIRVGFADIAWATEILNANGVSAGAWSVVTRIDLTQKYPLNFSPGNLSIYRTYLDVFL